MNKKVGHNKNLEKLNLKKNNTFYFR